MPHELVIFDDGSASVRPSAEGAEAMHSSIGAWEEARLLYVEQSRLRERLLADEGAGPLALYDVGMGIAANALAAIRCARGLGGARRGLHVVSFENALDALDLALANAGRFPFLEGYEEALRSLLSRGRWTAPGVEWELRAGDFRQARLGGPEPELIYYDFYSPRSVDRALWGVGSFARLWDACAGRRAAGLPVSLYTYSSATPARAAMLLAGFNVGAGRRTPIKNETTVASTAMSELEAPLGTEWLAKYERSSKALPADWEEERLAEARERVRGLAQFSTRGSAG